jgi:hypothetical protein
MTPQLKALLDRLPDDQRVDFANLQAALKAIRYTGPSVVHWLNGEPKQIDLGPPVKLSIVAGLDKRPQGDPP